ncbi:MAG: hypothetical protein JW771_01325 [Candidatus Thermoplasmatota archaeon]|nr:hypothetical protein [Candidatus Thermoplasmatota archaeon]
MNNQISSMKLLFSITILCMLLVGTVVPTVLGAYADSIQGCDKGPSYQPVVNLKKTTFVNFDEESYLDDYAYLAAVPTTVFNYDDMLFSYPLLFYQDEYPVSEDKERSLNARQGIDYFMEDWMGYCNGQLDDMTLINVPKTKLDSSWQAKEYTIIEGDDPYSIANDLALSEWSYSDNAVVAVITDPEQLKTIDGHTGGTLQGSIQPYNIGHQQFEMDEPIIGTGGTYETFEITDNKYHYVIAEMSWPNRIDLDLQLFDPEIGMVDNAAGDYKNPQVEVVGSFIHNYGKWQISVSAVPKKAINALMDPSTSENTDIFKGSALKELARTIKNKGDVNVWLYPGSVVTVEPTPFGCRNAKFTLSWDDPNINLGFTLLDAAGTEICSSLSKKEISSGELQSTEAKAELEVPMLGEAGEGEQYQVCVFSLQDVPTEIDFTLDYEWEQKYDPFYGNSMVSATNGAVLASTLNAPLLYTTATEVSEQTKDTLYTLGVEHIYLVDIGGHLSHEIADELHAISPVADRYTQPQQIYEMIKTSTDGNAIVFTTIDPWSYWYVEGLQPAGEYEGALFVGPATYLAAHHGSPVFIVDAHPELSRAVCYPTAFWQETSPKRHTAEPAAASMVLSGRQVYSLLEEYGFGKIEEGGPAQQVQETIITVAGQYDIGMPWDRIFTGAALNGRFWASPVDTAYAISRSMFYPGLIYQNPAMQGTVSLVNGSTSKIQRIGGRLLEPRGVTLVQTKPSREEDYTYPTLQTFNTYAYRFNQESWTTWNFRYTRADGVIPWVTDSPDPIDEGAAVGKSGAYYPDISETEVVPFYARKAGYDSVFSTEGSAVTENLNRGVILWVLKGHGWFMNSGQISMWDPENPYAYEENPWRVYEPVLLQPGNLREFIRWVIYASSGETPSKLTDGFVKFHLLSEIGSTENPDVATINPQLLLLNKYVASLLPIDLWGANGIMLYRDRLRHPLQALKAGLPLVNIYDGDGKVIISPASGHQPMTAITGLEFDDALGNVHSCGLNTGACLPAGTYMHLTWMRHGMVHQIIDPWTTSDWNGVWNQLIIKRLAMGDTIGQAYERGMRATAPELLVGQWWWDTWENVCFFGDPQLRIFVPGTDYSDNNYWTQEEVQPLRYNEALNVDGHMPFGATSYPHQKEPVTFIQQYFVLIVALGLIIVLLIAAMLIGRKK